MATEESKAALDRWLHLWNTYEAEAAVALVTDDNRRREPHAPDIDGPDAQGAFMEQVFTGYPDIHVEELHRGAEGARRDPGAPADR